MAGLLDFISTPEGQGLLSAAFGGLAGARRGTPFNNLGRAGLAGLGGYVDAQDRVTQQDQLAKMNQMRDLQLKQMQQQQSAAELARTQEAEFRNTIPSPQESMMQGALGGNRAPTMANAQQLTPVDPRQQLMFQAMRLGQMKPSEYLSATAKDDTPTILPEGANLVGGRASNFKVLASGAPKAGKESSLAQLLAERDSLPPGDPRLAFYNDAIKKATTNAPAVSVTVGDNLGLKPKDRFEMEDRLRNDYTAATASDSTVVSASQNIGSLLKQGGALKDQGAIYSFAKLLDPLGAVREADYAAIVKTAGGLDYVTSLFNRALTGEQLSPKQRLEMDRVATSMANVAKQRIAKQQKRFTGTAKMYNLQPENVFQTSEESTAADPLGLRK